MTDSPLNSKLTVKYSYKREKRTFKDTPKGWHQILKVKNPDTERNQLYFKCNFPGCNS